MDDYSKKIFKQTVELRKRGEFEKVVPYLNKLLLAYPDNTAIIKEFLYLTLLCKKYHLSLKFYEKIEKKGLIHQIEPEPLLRLYLCNKNNRVSINHLTLKNAKANWSRQYLQEKIDPQLNVILLSCSVDCIKGTVNYWVDYRCPDCLNEFKTYIPITLLVYREMICSSCFANLILEYENLVNFIKKKVKKSGFDFCELDYKMFKIRNALNFDSKEGHSYPDLCRYFGQDYVFILNQLIS